MDQGLNLKYLADYSEQFAQIISERAYRNSDHLNGKDLLSVTEIEQVNLFIVKNLFKAWQSEVTKLRSPYFDYDHPAVQKALNTFMNELSNHILLAQSDFGPLLTNALKNTLILMFSPYDYYMREIESFGEEVSVSDLKSLEKYVKINKGLYKAFLNKVYIESQSSISGKQAMEILNYIFESIEEAPDDVNQYLGNFNDVRMIDESKVYLTENTSAPDLKSEESEEPQESIHSLFAEAGEEKSTANTLRKIDTIKRGVTINQRFMFVNELFDKDAETFNQAIEELDKMDSLDTALTHLKINYAGKYEWDQESEAYEELVQVIERRFS